MRRLMLLPVVLLGFMAAGPLLPAGAAPGERTEVSITFDVSDPHYLSQIDDSDLPTLHAGAAAKIAEALGERIRFLRFGTNDQARYQIAVRLARPEEGPASGPGDFGFHFSLSGPDVPERTIAYALFRDKSRYSADVSDVQALALEIGLRMSEIAQRNEGDLVGAVLSQISFTNDAHFTKIPVTGWVIHHDRGAVCLDYDSILRVKSRIPAQQTFVREKFKARVIEIESAGNEIASVVEANDHPVIEHLRAAKDQDVSVEQVFVVEYRRSCPKRVQRGVEVDFSDAGS